MFDVTALGGTAVTMPGLRGEVGESGRELSSSQQQSSSATKVSLFLVLETRNVVTCFPKRKMDGEKDLILSYLELRPHGASDRRIVVLRREEENCNLSFRAPAGGSREGGLPPSR